MYPSNYRNVSGILIEFPDYNIIFDSGEGSFDQIYSHYGPENYKALLRKTKIIFISHIHGDHHLGLYQILIEYERILQLDGDKKKENELFVVIPFNLSCLNYFYKLYIHQFPHCKIVYSQDLFDLTKAPEVPKETNSLYTMSKNNINVEAKAEPEEKNSKEESKSNEDHTEDDFYWTPFQNELLNSEIDLREKNRREFIELLKNLEIKNFEPVRVDHCPDAHGIVVEFQNEGLKIVFSGDTRPSPNLIQKGENCSILIHEATFWEDLKKNAADHMHSTAHEAIEVAMKMKAKTLVLTHFSQRYNYYGYNFRQYQNSKEVAPEILDYLINNTVVAFDHLDGLVSEYQEKLPHVTRAICYALPIME